MVWAWFVHMMTFFFLAFIFTWLNKKIVKSFNYTFLGLLPEYLIGIASAVAWVKQLLNAQDDGIPLLNFLGDPNSFFSPILIRCCPNWFRSSHNGKRKLKLLRNVHTLMPDYPDREWNKHLSLLQFAIFDCRMAIRYIPSLTVLQV